MDRSNLGSFSIQASQLNDHEAIARKTAAAFSNALSIAKYVYNQPELSEESRLGLHQIKLDLVAGANYAWRSVHNHMLMRRSIVLDNLSDYPSDRSRSEVGLTPCTLQGYYPFRG